MGKSPGKVEAIEGERQRGRNTHRAEVARDDFAPAFVLLDVAFLDVKQVHVHNLTTKRQQLERLLEVGVWAWVWMGARARACHRACAHTRVCHRACAHTRVTVCVCAYARGCVRATECVGVCGLECTLVREGKGGRGEGVEVGALICIP